MFEYIEGDLVKANVQALVNPVNCSGVAEKGLSTQFKKAFPDNFHFYENCCKKHRPFIDGDSSIAAPPALRSSHRMHGGDRSNPTDMVRLGQMLVFDMDGKTGPRYIIN